MGCVRAPPTASDARRRPAVARVGAGRARRHTGASTAAPDQSAPVAAGRALRAADIIGIGASTRHRRRHLTHRAAGRITNFEPNYLASHRVPRRGLPVALHAGPAPSGGATPPLARCWSCSEDEFERRLNVKEATSRSISRPSKRRRTCSPSLTAVGLGPRARQRRTSPAPRWWRRITPRWPRRLDAAWRSADVAYSRILSPRRLEPDTNYRACLVPPSRAAGWPAGSPADAAPAPRSRPGPSAARRRRRHFRSTSRGTFRTGTIGDFESLVRLLQPRPVDKSGGCPRDRCAARRIRF